MVRAGTQTVLRGSVTGGGVVLRHPSWSEFEAWTALRRANRDYLAPWEPQVGEEFLTRNSYRLRLSGLKKMVSKEAGYPFHIFRETDDCFMGACNLTRIERSVVQSAHLGYWLGEHYCGRGYARAAVSAVMRFGFDVVGLHRLQAAVQAENERSVRLLESLGFQKEGTARAYLKINGCWRDHDIYARLSSD